MKRTLSFWKKVAAQAFEQTAFLARKRMLYSLGVGIAALVIQGEFGLHPWTNVAEIAASIIGAYILVTVLSFAWNLLRVPVIFYDDQQSTIKALEEVERTRQEASRNAKPFLWLSAASAPSQVLMVRRQHQGGGYS
jgi:divalent metal cation (Fe/Co/Zn/Cd) transporter